MQAQQMYLDYDGQNLGISIKMRQAGGHLLLFLHGFGCSKECFDPIFEVKGLADLSIATFDFPGHGASTRLAASAYSLQTYADIANMIVDRISPTRVSIIGHSMGGAVGLIASQARINLSLFVNVDGNLVAQDCGLVSRSTADQSFSDFSEHGYRDLLGGLRSSVRCDEQAWARWCALADPAALHALACSLVEWSDSGKILDLFRSIQQKVYIYGDQDSRDYILPELGNVAVYPIADSGHFMMLDNPKAFYGVIADLFADVSVR